MPQLVSRGAGRGYVAPHAPVTVSLTPLANEKFMALVVTPPGLLK